MLATKINLKLPGSGTAVKYHQDFPFEPHSNEDIMTVLYFLDDVTFDNGPLEVIPGSHKGEIFSLWQDGIFTGAGDKLVEEKYRKKLIRGLDINIFWFCLKGEFDLINQRLKKRNNHFFSSSLLQSQYDIIEYPDYCNFIDISESKNKIVELIKLKLLK